MYASLCATNAQSCELLREVASCFSPEVEFSSAGRIATFCIAPLRKLIGSPHQIASEICHAGYEFKLAAHLAIAANPDAAILLARHFAGVTLVTPGDERLKLASIPLPAVFEHDPVKLQPAMLEILLRWGVKTCEDLVALPEKGIVERLGPAAVYLRNLAAGKISRPLRLKNDRMQYELRMELEHSLVLLEPLFFLLSRAAGDLCHRLRAQSRAARELELKLELDTSVAGDEQVQTRAEPVSGPRPAACAAMEDAADAIQEPAYQCRLEFPVALDDPRTILKLLQLHLERHPPGGAVKAFTLRLEPAEPQRIQGGIFLPPTPAPDKLQITLARIAGIVGPENVGTPVLLNTHRPDAFRQNLLPNHLPGEVAGREEEATEPEILRLAMRLFRPALQARVQVVKLVPKNVLADGIKGRVLRYAGPWKTAGEWWAETAWAREEWDVALEDGALYRIYQESETERWYVHGVYD